MYTVLLVDDEDDVLKNLVNAIDWPVYGIGKVLTARDGLRACEILRCHSVDLLITDIRMPNMDGIQLIRHVFEASPHIRCILLSSYGDFQYAKEAISLGVENYLLKPVNADELDNSIRKALDNLSMQKHVMRSLFAENILYRWLTDDISSDELSTRAKHIGLNIYFRNYCVVVIKALKRAPMSQFLSAFYSSAQPTCDIYRFVNYEGHHVSIFGSHAVTQQQIADALMRSAKEFPQIAFHAAIGNIVENYEAAHQSYQSALDCLYANSFSSPQGVCLASEKIDVSLTSLHINAIVEYLKDAKTGSTALSLFRSTFASLQNCSLSELNSFINILTVRLALQLSASGLIGTQEKDNVTSYIYHFGEMPSEQNLLSWFENILSVCQALILKHAQQLNPTIILAMQYIADHHAEYVSIKDFCNRHNMNASYLGLLFKKETGIYFKDYINQIRISHAIHLIKHSDLKIMDICKTVGFANTSYFILCFKKQTGLSPTQYKQMLNEKHTE